MLKLPLPLVCIRSQERKHGRGKCVEGEVPLDFAKGRRFPTWQGKMQSDSMPQREYLFIWGIRSSADRDSVGRGRSLEHVLAWASQHTLGRLAPSNPHTACQGGAKPGAVIVAKCRNCGSDDGRRSRFRGFSDYVRLALLLFPIRCRDCGMRSHVFLSLRLLRRSRPPSKRRHGCANCQSRSRPVQADASQIGEPAGRSLFLRGAYRSA